MKLNLEKESNRIENFVKSYVLEEAAVKGVVIGISGGIDSALTAAVCVKALGKENVLGLIMPIHSMKDDAIDAMKVIKHLNIKHITINLSDTYNILKKTLEVETNLNKMSLANIRPRLRMTTLYAFAQQYSYLVVGTGNKAEDTIGFFTKYGDGGVDFLPIAHLYKHEVRELGAYYNLPSEIINRIPSPGLWEGHTDEGELSEQLGFIVSYNILDEMIANIETNKYNKDDYKYKKLIKRIKKNEHKIKYPPSLQRL
ncbi:MAG: NAD(+) synthase [Candidatus Hodarchaeales archaeon]